MPASHNVPAATQEPTSPDNEHVSAHCAYRLISQLRERPPAPAARPRDDFVSLDARRAARPIRAVEFFVSGKARA